MIIDIVDAVWIASAAVYLFSLLTWRRILARRALASSLASALVLAILSGAASSWVWMALGASSLIAVIEFAGAEIHPRKGKAGLPRRTDARGAINPAPPSA